MASKQAEASLKDVIITEIVPLKEELEHGAYGRVFTVKYRGVVCAAKEIRPFLSEAVINEKEIIDNFVRECRQRSVIHHPNIIQFWGVYYSSKNPNLPIIVMELMDTTLSSFVKSNQFKITMKTKISILYDVSLGLSYLHNRNPVVIHRYLSSNTIMLTSHLVAKITDLGVDKLITNNEQTMSRLTTAAGTVDFMPPETFEANPVCNTAVDVFSFACIALQVLAEEWPKLCNQKRQDPVTKKLVAVTEVERRQKYLDKIPEGATVLTKLLERCLADYSDERPSIKEIFQMIKTLKVH